MGSYAIPFLAAVALGGSATGVILLLDSQDRRTYVASMAGASTVLALALWLVAITSRAATAQSAYVAFACGLVVWGWMLLAFYTGFVTGPNKNACTPDSGAVSRFMQAVAASLHHEIAAVLGAAALLALTYGQPNKVALWTYVIVWLMHSSAKLNLFFGVPNLGAEMFPDHLAFLTSFMACRPMNAFFPVSVTVGTVVSTLLFLAALRSGASAFDVAAFAMLGSLMALAVLEHWFMVVSIDGNALWRSFRRNRADGPPEAAATVERGLGPPSPPIAPSDASLRSLESEWTTGEDAA